MTQVNTQFGKVAVLLGGNSAEREVSLRSGQAVLNALQNSGIDAIAFDPQSRSLWELKELNVDRVFIALHGRGGEDGTVQGALEFMDLPYTGSNVLGSALAMDKVRCKHLFKSAGLSTAPYTVVDAKKGFDAAAIMDEFKKVMVKPSHEGSSIGMAQASTTQELEDALANAFKFDNQVLVEQWITGREFTITVLGDDVQPVIEMTTPNGFYDYQAKYQSNTTQYHCPADLSEQDTKYLQAISLDAFDLVGASGWGRVDAMQDEQGNFYLLEVNTVPGMTEKSLVPMAAKANGATFEQLVVRILEQTL
ncbi:D-alanine--D-alanine ligase [Pseudoalteromonas issachenkonii]|jgi:D-alanine-D-alanine ligase|uniref:D-alanine--D-alanine ligase n=1 Tax=Pseudoalteromonas issachenkonii TaxID=152297 RepID=A0ABN5BXV1_9GAMM|nr:MULTISPECIES: D-alanine--D-alanine ligase [Pseudoalteromonas]ALQ53849.1 D-alanine--D-alanine ligase [Pseudoalteromonas issachenkonii]ATC89617.1 D-alanine-D-alanine ligase [Pseudoalteromonas issachenkonii]MBB1276093.1 D-alanine--D-alanine ligase [Pseudoalteromonas sp. SR43-3]MBB1303938.1 D-alanine--D-alanine ligase [Pseudoalteromonas sp. SR43-5]MBB1324489.1 D-alanine--D-alanine ligase [Pseudoalteromonas sp. SR45-1]|tara:strand:+ start:1479 stop:2399 length:921 start_codon:yes stop_codon:yes gene_type:complete